MTPADVLELTTAAMKCRFRPEGDGSAISDDDYLARGAWIDADADAVFGEAEMIVKVKEPLARLPPCRRRPSCLNDLRKRR